MSKDLDNIKDLLKDLPKYKVSGQTNQKILKSLKEARPKSGSSFNFLTPFLMKRLSIAVIAIVLVVGGIYYYKPIPKATAPIIADGTYAEHIQKAHEALAKLQNIISGQGATAWIPAAFAQSTGTPVVLTAEEEALVEKLTQQVIAETNAAVKASEAIQNPEAIQTALEDVSNLQDKVVNVLQDAANVVETDSTAETVAAALDTTVDQQTAVDNAVDSVETAIDNGKKIISIKIPSADLNARRQRLRGKMEERAKTALKTAKAKLNELIATGATDEEIANVENRLTKIDKAITEGKFGQAFVQGNTLSAMEKYQKHRRERKEKNIKRAEAFLDKSAEKLAELTAEGATESEIADFEAKVNKLQSAVDTGDLKLIQKAKRETRKEYKEKLKERQVEFKRELANLPKDERQQKIEEFKAKAEETRKEFQAKNEEKQQEREDNQKELEKKFEEMQNKRKEKAEERRKEFEKRFEEHKAKVKEHIQDLPETDQQAIFDRMQGKEQQVKLRMDEKQEKRDELIQAEKQKRDEAKDQIQENIDENKDSNNTIRNLKNDLKTADQSEKADIKDSIKENLQDIRANQQETKQVIKDEKNRREQMKTKAKEKRENMRDRLREKVQEHSDELTNSPDENTDSK